MSKRLPEIRPSNLEENLKQHRRKVDDDDDETVRNHALHDPAAGPGGK